MPYPFHSLAFLGCGRIAQSLIKGYLSQSGAPSDKIFASGRNFKKTQRVCEKLKIQMAEDNEELLDKGSVIFICVKPQDMEEALEGLKAHWRSDHTVFSLAAGLSFKTLKSWGLNCRRLIRLLPNTAASLGQGVLPFCSLNNQESLNSFAEKLLEPLGHVFALKKEDLLFSATVGSACGLGFALELMQYWQEWLQGEGFSDEMARSLTAQTFLGAGEMGRKKSGKSFSDWQKEIASPQGATLAGLSAMREMELERILRLSFEKTALKIKELGKGRA